MTSKEGEELKQLVGKAACHKVKAKKGAKAPFYVCGSDAYSATTTNFTFVFTSL